MSHLSARLPARLLPFGCLLILLVRSAAAGGGATELLSASAHGGPALTPASVMGAPSLSDDGRYVGFRSNAVNYTPDRNSHQSQNGNVFVKDMQTGQLETENVTAT